MRKKLLALVMCATMVLGTAVTASAAVPSEDTFKAAKAVFSAGSKFDAEYEGKKLVKFTTSDSVDGKTSVWGLKAFGDATAEVKLGKDGDLKDKALLHVGTSVTGTFVKDAAGYYVNKNNDQIAYGAYFLVKERATTNASSADLVKTTSTSSVEDGLATAVIKVNPSADAATVVSAEGTDYVGYVADGVKYLVNSNGVRVASVVNNKIVFDKAPVLYTAADLLVEKDGVYAVGNKLVYIENAGTTAAKSYDVDKDGYIQKKDADATDKLVKADASSVTRSDDADAQYYVVLEQLKDTEATFARFQRTVAYALDEKKLSKDAVAVKVRLFELVDAGNRKAASSEDAIKYLKNVNSVTTTTSITLNNDVLSRTGLKTASGLSVYTIDLDDTEKKDGVNVAKLESLGTTAVDATFTFDVKDYTNHVIIFDGYAAESTDNAGQADADKTTDSTTSPKTGDVAPIAALAVVMMGAFGAMVVASKKRA